jgi:hypothetical protein
MMFTTDLADIGAWMLVKCYKKHTSSDTPPYIAYQRRDATYPDTREYIWSEDCYDEIEPGNCYAVQIGPTEAEETKFSRIYCIDDQRWIK